MSRAAWSCDCCDTNNTAECDACRNCGAERAVAGSAVPERTRSVPRVHDTAEQPVFFDSAHSSPEEVAAPTSSRIRFSSSLSGTPADPRPRAPEPAREKPALTPGPPSRPPVHRPSSGGGRAVGAVLLWVLVVVALLVVAKYWDSISDFLSENLGGSTSTDSSAVASTSSAPSCPSEVAQWLPD